jgi:hypothetical protein
MLGRGRSGEDKDTGANDAADTEEDELPAMQFSAKMTFSITCFAELIHRLGSENVHNTYPGWRDGYPNLLLPSDNLSTSQAVILAFGSNDKCPSLRSPWCRS